jgi:hypothetical protein
LKKDGFFGTALPFPTLASTKNARCSLKSRSPFLNPLAIVAKAARRF